MLFRSREITQFKKQLILEKKENKLNINEKGKHHCQIYIRKFL